MPLDPNISVKVVDIIQEIEAVRIQETAKRLGISARMLRHYETEGLIVPRRSANGYRQYTLAELEQAGWVRDFIACGFSTRELRQLVSALDDSAQGPELNCSVLMREKLDQIDRLVGVLTARRRALSSRLSAWERDGVEQHKDIPDEETGHAGAATPAV